MKLANYLRRIAVAEAPKPDLATLAMIMASHSRAIAFENFDVVQRKPISMAPADVERKLVDEGRGGYCWEQNQLLHMALEEIGFDELDIFDHVAIHLITRHGTCQFLRQVRLTTGPEIDPVQGHPGLLLRQVEFRRKQIKIGAREITECDGLGDIEW